MASPRIFIKKNKVIYKDLSKNKVVGYAYRDENGEFVIEIDPNQNAKEVFLTAVHELFHNLLPSLSERRIIKLEKTFGDTLWKVVLRLRRLDFKQPLTRKEKSPILKKRGPNKGQKRRK